MGQPKLLLPWAGKTLIAHVVRQWMASHVERVIVVVRGDDRVLCDELERSGAEVLRAADPPADMRASLVLGTRYIAKRLAPQPEDGLLFAPADVPHVTPELIDQVLAAARHSPGSLIVPRCGVRRAHPLFMPWTCVESLESLAAGQGPNALLERFPVRELPWDDPSILADLDTPDDYRHWHNRA